MNIKHSFKIGEHLIGNNNKPFIIAEAGSNFNQSMDTAYRLIDVAVDANADAVKFQLFSAESLYPKGTKEYDSVKAVELNPDWIEPLNTHAAERNICFMASAFDISSVDILEAVDVCAHKIASSETTNLPLLSYIATKKRPVIISTGMCDMVDISEAVLTCHQNDNESIVLLQCYALYPLPIERANIAVMDSLQELFQLPTGFSDHTLGLNVSVAAAARGACVIEKHFTLDRESEGPDHFYAIEPNELKQLVKAINEVHLCIGEKTKEMMPEERKFGRREGLYANRDFVAGDIIDIKDIEIKRPAIGLRARYEKMIIGSTVKNSIKKGESITMEHLGWHSNIERS